jgi:cytochrome b subunit of formate dehydrogenase
MIARRTIIKMVPWLLFVVSIMMVITGLGITRPVIVTPLTFGILDKAVSYQLHVLLWGPFLVLLLIHVYMFGIKKKY